jgi:hypothetical protein
MRWMFYWFAYVIGIANGYFTPWLNQHPGFDCTIAAVLPFALFGMLCVVDDKISYEDQDETVAVA